jgi:hypothetical protein
MGVSTRGEAGEVLRNRGLDGVYRDSCFNTGRNPVGTRMPGTSFTHPHNSRTIHRLSSFIQSTGYYTNKKVNVSLTSPALFYVYLSKTAGILDYNLEFEVYLLSLGLKD